MSEELSIKPAPVNEAVTTQAPDKEAVNSPAEMKPSQDVLEKVADKKGFLHKLKNFFRHGGEKPTAPVETSAPQASGEVAQNPSETPVPQQATPEQKPQ